MLKHYRPISTVDVFGQADPLMEFRVIGCVA